MSTLVVARLVDTKRCLRPVRNVGHRHEVDARRVRTVDREELDLPGRLVSIDGVQLQDLDYVDIGEMISPPGVVPIVIKSLLFS